MATTRKPPLTIRQDGNRLILSGRLTIHELMQAKREIRKVADKVGEVDLTDVEHLDTAGALYLQRWLKQVEFQYRDEKQQHLLEMMGKIARTQKKNAPKELHSGPFHQAIAQLGRKAIEGRKEVVRVLTFGGKAAVLLVRALRHPKHLRIPAIAQHIDAIGVQALPIIGLMAFLIAIVLAYQGVAQLRPYGGEQFTVNLVALSILREMGVLLTAIMVAGRSGSAFTAEIGTMKAREEVDALQVMGLDPFDMLVLPRMIAILIALPLLTFYADMMGLLGGLIITHSLINVGWTQYFERIHLAVGFHDYAAGFIKAPVFAFVIGLVGCMHGLRVGGDAESIGRETTASVVKSIFLVLTLDAFFSIFFEQVGI